LKRWLVGTLVAVSLLVGGQPTYAKRFSEERPRQKYKKKDGTKFKEHNDPEQIRRVDNTFTWGTSPRATPLNCGPK
jgi:hypothetical protein